MGTRSTRSQTVIRAVLDTNVVISALLFSGPPAQLLSAWHSGLVRPVVSASILDEYIRVLAYPKFKLTSAEIHALVEDDLLPFIETVKVTPSAIPALRDIDDAKFVTCATTAVVRWLVSGDDDLLSLRRVGSVEIVSITSFLQHLRKRS